MNWFLFRLFCEILLRRDEGNKPSRIRCQVMNRFAQYRGLPIKSFPCEILGLFLDGNWGLGKKIHRKLLLSEENLDFSFK